MRFLSSCKWMVAGCFLLWTALASAGEPVVAGMQAGALQAGEEYEVCIPGSNNPMMRVFLPLNYVPERSWPVIFYYPEKTNAVTTSPIKEYVGRKDFVIVGMPYVAESEVPKTQMDSDRLLLRELSNFRLTRAWIGKYVNIDEKRVLMGGVSYGGWATCALAEHEASQIAGMFVLLAGRQRARIDPRNAKAFKLKPFYIGAGEKDPNLFAALAAVDYYRRRGAAVTYEIYIGAGHALPAAVPERFRSWLDAMGKWHAGDPVAALSRVMDRDLKVALDAAMNKKDALARYNAFAALEMDPRLTLCSAGLSGDILKQIKSVKAATPGKEESFAETTFFELLNMDGKIRTIEQLQVVHDSARRLNTRYPDTFFGKLAGPYYERLDQIYQKVLKKMPEDSRANKTSGYQFRISDGPVRDIIFKFKQL